MRTAAQWLEDPNTYTTCVMALLLDKYTMEFLEWDPLALSMDIKSDFKIDPDDQVMDKVGAGSALLTSNLFFVSLEAFNATCNTLNLGINPTETFLPADLDDIHWGLLESRLLLGDEFTEGEFSHDIARYCGQLMADRGIYEPPPILQFAEFDETTVRNLADIAATPGEDLELDFFKAHMDNAQDERDSMTSLANAKLDELVDQLKELPIKNRNNAWFDQLT